MRDLPLGDIELFNGGNWQQMYVEVKEQLPPDQPTTKMKPVKIVIFFDASFT